MNLLRACLAIHKFDIFCLTETYFNSTIRSDDDSLSIPGYNFKRCDDSLQCKEYLTLKILDITYSAVVL